MRELTRRRFAVPWLAPRREGWWLLLAVGGFGAYQLVDGLIPAARRFPTVLPTAVLASVPLLAVWLLLLRLPQLWARIARSGALAAVLWGALAATGAYALSANDAIITMVAQHGSVELAQAWGAAIAAPIVEETAKALAIAVVLLASAQRLRTAADGALIGAMSGLGFTVAEDLLYAYNVTSLNLGEQEVGSTLVIYLLRAVVFGTVSHVVFSAAVGAGIGMLLTRRPVPEGVAWIACGYGMHGLWNSPLLDAIWMRFVFAGLVPLVVWLLLHRLRSHESAWFASVMARPGALGDIPAAYLESMRPTWFGRRRYRAMVVRRFGPAARAPQRLLEARLSDLADAVASGDEAMARALREDVMARLAGTRP